MKYTSRHDLPWWSDPDYDEIGRLIEEPVDDGDEQYEIWKDRQENECEN